MVRMLFAALPLALMGAGPLGTIAVEVTGVRNAKGVVHVDLCPQAQFLKDSCVLVGDAPARAGVTTVVVNNVPAGRYAAQVFHDENRNRKVDRALFGIPKEGIGFSRDAPVRMSPPKWDDARFDFAGGRQAIRLKMRYMLGGSGPKS